MRDSRPQLLDVLFDDASAGSKGPLHNVQQRAVALLKLNRAVKGLLPAPLHPWCRVANLTHACWQSKPRRAKQTSICARSIWRF